MAKKTAPKTKGRQTGPKGKRKPSPPANRPGRPTLYTDEIAEAICQGIADGKSLRTVCEDENLPSRETVRRWLRDNESFRGQYARAREEQADYYADDIVEIADTESDPQKARVRIDARKWTASKLKPKKYGDRVAVTGPGGGPIQTFDLSKLKDLTDEELDAAERIHAKLAALGGDPGGEEAAGD